MVFLESPDNHQLNYINNLKGANRDIEIFDYTVNDYYSKTKDHRIYTDVIDYCEEHKIKNLFMPFFLYPEYLLMELYTRPDLDINISLGMAMSQWHKSYQRSYAYELLMKTKQVHSVLCYTLDGEGFVYPDFAKNVECEKFHPWFEFTQETEEDYRRYKTKENYYLKNNDFVALFFGSMFYGKGVDIFANAMNLTDPEVKYLVSSRTESINFDFDPIVFKEMGPRQGVFFDYRVPDRMKLDMFSISDVILFPYRRTYEYGSSAVYIQAMLAKKLVIVPDFYPFNAAVKKYKTGELFEPENPESLAAAIDYVYHNYDELYENAMFDEYLSKIQTWEQILDKVVV
jgi:glycosyltransferase involved in cell wall biosynthesis